MYTTGDAKDLIKHWIQQPSAEGYENVDMENHLRYWQVIKEKFKNDQVKELVMQVHLDSFTIFSSNVRLSYQCKVEIL